METENFEAGRDWKETRSETRDPLQYERQRYRHMDIGAIYLIKVNIGVCNAKLYRL